MNFVLDHLTLVIVGLVVLFSLLGIPLGLYLDRNARRYPPVDEP